MWKGGGGEVDVKRRIGGGGSAGSEEKDWRDKVPSK